MKKNKMMRLASVLLVLTLLSTSVISGTFAKYVTEGSAVDSARVAKWGVTVDISGSLFGEDYVKYATDNTNSNKISASAEATLTSANSIDEINGIRNIVAPGTQSDKGLILSVNGKPEVDSKVTLTFNADNEEIWLDTGHYGVLVQTDKVTEDNFKSLDNVYYSTDSGVTFTKVTDTTTWVSSATWYILRDQINLTEKYYPLRWYVNGTGSDPVDSSSFICASIEEMREPLVGASGIFSNNFYKIQNNDANEEINVNISIGYQWAFEREDTPMAQHIIDGADTILGNLMAAEMETDEDFFVIKSDSNTYDSVEPIATDDYNLEVKFGATITAEQVD